MQFEYKITPFPAVRSNRGSSWTPRTVEYHDKMNHLRLLLNKDKDIIIDALLQGNYKILFILPKPNSWSKAKKARETVHRQKPDIDNLFKAFVDTVFYGVKQNDSGIHTMNASKIWGDEGKILFKVTGESFDMK